MLLSGILLIIIVNAMPSGTFLLRHTPIKKVRHCDTGFVTSSDACCQRAFAHSAFDYHFLTLPIVTALNNRMVRSISVDPRRPIESIEAECHASSSPTAAAKRRKGNSSMCHFSCRDTRTFSGLLELPEISLLKDAEAHKYALTISKYQERELPGFTLKCPGYMEAFVEEVETKWKSAPSNMRKRVVCKDPFSPKTTLSGESQPVSCVDDDDSALEADPDFTIPENLVWTAHDQIRFGVDFVPRASGLQTV